MSIISGFTESSGDRRLEDRFQQGVSFYRLPAKREEADYGHLAEQDPQSAAEKASDPMVETCFVHA